MPRRPDMDENPHSESRELLHLIFGLTKTRKGHAVSLFPKVKAGTNKAKLLLKSRMSRVALTDFVYGCRYNSLWEGKNGKWIQSSDVSCLVCTFMQESCAFLSLSCGRGCQRLRLSSTAGEKLWSSSRWETDPVSWWRWLKRNSTSHFLMQMKQYTRRSSRQTYIRLDD